MPCPELAILTEHPDFAEQISGILGSARCTWVHRSQLSGFPDIPPFRLVIVDGSTDHRSAVEIVSALRENHARLVLPLIVLGDMKDEGSLVEIFKAGANDLIATPVNPVELKAKIQLWLSRAAQRDSLKLVDWLRAHGRRTISLPEDSTFLFDRFKVIGEIGRGATARIFSVSSDDGPVALKVFLPTLADGPTHRRRFLRERRVLASLDHPCIVRHLQSGCHEGFDYFTMSLLDGGTVWDRVASSGKLPAPDSIKIARDVAQAVSYLHRQNLLHRDVKPENMLLSKAGSAFLGDFGLARQTSHERITERITFIGTPGYVPLEEVMGGEPTKSRDVFSLGVSIHVMLFGHLPNGIWESETPYSVDSIPGCPDDFRKLMLRMIDREMKRRPEAFEVNEILDRIHNEL